MKSDYVGKESEKVVGQVGQVGFQSRPGAGVNYIA